MIWGKQDHALRFEMAEKSLVHCKAGRLVVIEDATHWVQHGRPEVFNAHMISFLSE